MSALCFAPGPLSPPARTARWHLPRLPTALLTKMMDEGCPLGSITFVYTGAHSKAALLEPHSKWRADKWSHHTQNKFQSCHLLLLMGAECAFIFFFFLISVLISQHKTSVHISRSLTRLICHSTKTSHDLFIEMHWLGLTALIKESSTLTANAVPQANGWVRYNSVSGSSSSSWSRNWTFESFTMGVKVKGKVVI